MINTLPVELALAIIAYLPISSIHAIQLTCKQLNDFVLANELQLYHAAAIQMGYIPSLSFSTHDISSLDFAYGINDWKSLCQRRFQIERSWSGEDYSTLSAFTATGTLVHRFKVDEEVGIIVCTTQGDGVRVVDLRENKLLWSLSGEYVRAFAHCEYEKGFLIFDRLDRGKEVWRLADDYPAGEPDQSVKYPPRDHQIAASEQAFLQHESTYPRGHFKPWALFIMPRPTRAFRFVYPTLLVGSTNEFFLWDVRSRDLVQTIPSRQNPTYATVAAQESIAHLSYVEVSEKHVFVCSATALLVFSRSDGRRVLELPSDRFAYGPVYALQDKVEPPEGIQSVMVRHPLAEGVSRTPPLRNRRYFDEFTAVHVSSCGRHLIAMLASSRLVVIKHFEQGINGLEERMFQINVGSPRSASKYLTFVKNKVAVASNRGIFVLNLKNALEDGHDSGKAIVVSRIPALHSTLLLHSISCLHMTDSAVYFNWHPEELDDDTTDSEQAFTSWLRDSTFQRTRKLI
ncbi:hypothetical protein K435DRAFT_663256 [Dendrothele bispora CBS 962.96]|uniref:F-box domain-containing protein n=1 Tax=Dendrothele bispora (strain CBS 962.96) TaxID=1314807 RepID=A0A4S8M5W4_DENBC|nr:hypothetical protein K435DRAFT_663256 [Dendrothele bispora CBS 962.96]